MQALLALSSAHQAPAVLLGKLRGEGGVGQLLAEQGDLGSILFLTTHFTKIYNYHTRAPTAHPLNERAHSLQSEPKSTFMHGDIKFVRYAVDNFKLASRLIIGACCWLAKDDVL